MFPDVVCECFAVVGGSSGVVVFAGHVMGGNVDVVVTGGKEQP